MLIRPTCLEDLPLIFRFIQRKIDFDRAIGAYSGTPGVTEEKLQRTLFGEHPFAYVLFAERSDGRSQLPIGFALYGFRYSSFAAQPSLWLDDLFVDVEMRGQGAGASLMNALAEIARSYDCTHLAWNADARNTGGLSFYRRLGATIVEQRGNRCFWQWTPEIEP